MHLFLSAVRNTLFRGLRHGHKHTGHCNGVWQWGRDIRFNNEFNSKKWDFLAKAQDEGSVDGKLLKGNIRVMGHSGQTNLIGSLLKAGQGDQTLPEGVVNSEEPD